MADPNPQTSSEMTPERQAHRKAGEKYFEEVLKKVQAGKDPYQPRQLSDIVPSQTHLPPNTQNPETREKTRPKNEIEDPDIQAVGTIIEGAQLYLILIIYILCTPASLVLTRSTLIFLKTPSVLFFLYAISIMLLATLSAQWTKLSPPGKNRQLFQRKNLVYVGIQGLKQLGFFGILVNNSLYLGIALALTTNQAVALLIKLQKNKKYSEIFSIPSVPVIISIFGAILSLIGSGLTDIYSISMFILFLGACTAEKWIDQNKEEFEKNLQKFSNFQKQLPVYLPDQQNQQLQQQQQQELKEIDKLFLLQIIDCVPILILGFIMKEGVEVVEHEPSVPTLSIMLLGCATFALSKISGAVLTSVQGGKTFVISKILALILIIIFNLIERGLAPTGLVMLTLVGAIVVVLGHSCAMWQGTGIVGLAI